MKKILIILSCLLMAASCIRSRQIEEAGVVTDSFLRAYCSGDWTTAASFCTEPLKSHIADSPALTAGTDTSVVSAAVGILKGLQWDKEPVETEEETDDVTFTCSTFYSDSTLSYTITLTPVEKTWVIKEII